MPKEVEIIKGDLLTFPCEINTIAHSCNTQNVMGAGIAGQIKNLYPEAFEADSIAKKANENQLGYFSFCKLNSDSKKRVINLYTQDQIGQDRMVNYEAFYKSIDYLSRAINSCDNCRDYVLGLPFGISCGLAGGSWGIIWAMLNDVFANKDFKTYIVRKEDCYA